MSQRRFWNFRDDDLTKDINRWLLGIIEPGLYRGFDPVLNPGMSLRLNHTVSGVSKAVDADENVVPNYGVFVTRQGVIVHDDTVLDLDIDVTGAFTRTDAIIYTHKYTEIEGGETGLYSLLKGADNGGAPLLINPETQTILGYIYLPANTNSLDSVGVIYSKFTAPTFADQALPIYRENGFFINDLNARTNRILNLKSPSNLNDAANKFYVDQAIANNVALASQFVRGIIQLGTLSEALLGTDILKAMTPFTTKGAIDDRIASAQEVFEGVINTKFVTPKTFKQGLKLVPETYAIRFWNMDANADNIVNHNYDAARLRQIVSVEAFIVSDDEVERSKFEGEIDVESNVIRFTRPNGGKYDNANYDSTVVTRGWVVVWFNENVSTSGVFSVDAGADQVQENDTTFDLSAFVDIAGSALTGVLWDIVSQPAGAAGSFNDDTDQNPIFTADEVGTYELRITATNTEGDTVEDTLNVVYNEQVNTAPVINSISSPNLVNEDDIENGDVNYGEYRDGDSGSRGINSAGPYWRDQDSTQFSDTANNEIQANGIGGQAFVPSVDKLVEFDVQLEFDLNRFPGNPSLVPVVDVEIYGVGPSSTKAYVVTSVNSVDSGNGETNMVSAKLPVKTEAGWTYELRLRLKTFNGAEQLTINVKDLKVKHTSGEFYAFDIDVNATDADGDVLTHTVEEVVYAHPGNYGAVISDSIMSFNVPVPAQPNAIHISGIEPDADNDIWKGFRVTTDDGTDTDTEFFAIEVKKRTVTSGSGGSGGGSTPPPFKMSLGADSAPESYIYDGFLSINLPANVNQLQVTMNSNVPQGESFTAFLNVDGNFFGEGTHDITSLKDTSLPVRLEMFEVSGGGFQSFVTASFRAYDSSGTLLKTATIQITA